MSITVNTLVQSGAISVQEGDIWLSRNNAFKVQTGDSSGDMSNPSFREVAPDLSFEAKQQIAAKVDALLTNYGSGAPPPVPDHGAKPAPPTGAPTAPATDGMPPPIKAPGGKGTNLAVSTADLKRFSANIKVLQDLVVAEHRAVSLVDLRPGIFGAGAHVSTAVQVGLRNDTLGFLNSVAETFHFLRLDIEKLIKEYDTAEEWNTLSVQQLNTVFNDAFSKIGMYSTFGNASTTPSAGTGSDPTGKTPAP